MATTAAYDEVADWYENEFLPGQRRGDDDAGFADRIGVDQALVELLGSGDAICLEVGCGTGIYAERIAGLGHYPIGLDVSARMLSYASDRLPVVQGDACLLPFADGSLDAVVSVMTHTDLPDYRPVLGEINRVLRTEGVFVHIGVHPCFCGDFADRSDNEAIVIRSGYLDGGWTPGLGASAGALGRDGQVRDKVGAGHLPLAALLTMVTDSGFSIEDLREGGRPTPITLSVRAVKRS